jgi:hypothetical protein
VRHPTDKSRGTPPMRFRDRCEATLIVRPAALDAEVRAGRHAPQSRVKTHVRQDDRPFTGTRRVSQIVRGGARLHVPSRTPPKHRGEVVSAAAAGSCRRARPVG